MKNIKTQIKAVPGDRVLVENYRTSNKEWEEGKVCNVKISVREDGTTTNFYDVRVDRPSTKRHPWKTGYTLSVGDAGIREIS